MGGYTTFLHPGVDPNKIQGIVLNPMQQSEPRKVAIFGNACYSWNVWQSEEEAQKQFDNAESIVAAIIEYMRKNNSGTII